MKVRTIVQKSVHFDCVHKVHKIFKKKNGTTAIN